MMMITIIMMMLAAVLLGATAACVVVLIPMATAGWHLSRNNVLIFCTVIFITLAFCVHLTPYFSSVSDYVTSVSSVAVFDRRSSCTDLINRISWEVTPNASLLNFNGTQILSSSFDFYEKRWDWTKSRRLKACRIHKFSESEASRLLNSSWVVIAGDSQARLFTLSLLNLILGSKPQRMDSIKAALFQMHSNYSISVDEIGMKLDFIWAPYVLNLTHLMMDFNAKKSYPDVIVMGAGLWHMLHFNNASDYETVLRMLKGSVLSLFPFSPELAIKSPRLFWLGFPVLINGMLKSYEKRVQMNDAVWHAYDRALGDSRLLRQTGGPLVLLDIQSLTWNCGAHCTYDGMNYDIAIYEAALQIMLNSLRTKSRHRHRSNRQVLLS